MKKIILLSVFFLSIQGFAQKTITIYNLSSTNFDIGEMRTKSTSVSTYPKLISNYGTFPNNIIHIPAGTTYILESIPGSITRFPFLSPDSTPEITSWKRQFNAGATWTPITSTAAAAAYGNTQVFDVMKTQVGPNGALGGGYLSPFPTPLDNYWVFYTWNSINGLDAGMVTIDSNLPFTDEITIIITD